MSNRQFQNFCEYQFKGNYNIKSKNQPNHDIKQEDPTRKQ